MNLPPQFFDIFGVVGFFLITFIAIWGISHRNHVPSKLLKILLFIGLAGLAIDSFIVYKFYFA